MPSTFRCCLWFATYASIAAGLGIQIPRLKWTVSASSQQSGHEVQKAIDGNRATFWRASQGSAHPYDITIDLHETFLVNGLSVLPRQDESGEAIAQHVVEVSPDCQNWATPVAFGTWREDKEVKTVSFVPRIARCIRLTAVTEAQGRTTSSLAEINVHRVPDPYLDRADWTVTVDSDDSTQAGGSAQKVLDNSPYTYWITKSGSQAPPHPHYLTIDQRKKTRVSGLSYTPRQGNDETDGTEIGRIGKYRVEYSENGRDWKTIVTGEWPDDFYEKGAFWPAIEVRYIRLVALSEAGHRGPLTSAGEVQLMFGSSLADFRAPSPEHGVWSHTIDFPMVPAAAANLWTGDSGDILVWAAYRNTRFDSMNEGKTQIAIWNSTSGSMTPETIANTHHDMFCPGVSMDCTGRIVVTGGNDAARTSIFDPARNVWTKAADMNIPRGYQASATLSDGNVFTIGGSWSGELTRPKDGELYDIEKNEWSRLFGCPANPILTRDRDAPYRPDNHAWLFGWSNGSVFHAGPSTQMNWFNTNGNGSVTSAGSRGSDIDSMNGIAVMYDAIAGKIFTAGGAVYYEDIEAHASAHIITIKKGVHQVPQAERVLSMSFARGFHTSVVLPDGTILISGGQSYVKPFTDTHAIMTPELFDPVSKTYTQLNPHAVPRTYHSVSLLLKDGTIFLGGGGLCGPCATNHFDGEVLVPPYLFNADGTRRSRPEIISLSSSIAEVGDTLHLSTSRPVKSIALMRLGSVTHTVNTDQRRLPFATEGTQHSITLPSDPGVALPGHYFVFVVDEMGTPSVARSLQITNGRQAPSRAEDLPQMELLAQMESPGMNTGLVGMLRGLGMPF